ncbi:MAG: hypothetical protein PHS84_03760 [Paludibacter sp.]|nr:hypothetical protein [Paludibacter sp.]
MLMFQNGLLATFIPEILMVVGYLFCLFSPKINTEPSTPELNFTNTTQIYSTQKVQQNTFITTCYDFQSEDFNFSELQNLPAINSVRVKKLFELYLFKLSDGLTFEQFSRPPPSRLC